MMNEEQEEQLPRKVYVEGHCTMVPERLGPEHCLHGTTTSDQCCCWCGDVFEPESKNTEHGRNFHPLSPRMVQVLQLIVDGCSNDEIGVKLQITSHTAKYYVRHLMNKLKQKSRVALATYAVRTGIIP